MTTRKRKNNPVGVVAVPKESKQQEMLFEAMAMILVPLPKGGWLKLSEIAFAVPNGTSIAGTSEQRARYMNALKKQGFKVGVSDIVIPYPTEQYPGLFIELKRDKHSVVSSDQEAWRDRMRALGYRAEICVGWYAAYDVIREYIGKNHRNVSRQSSAGPMI